MEYYDKVWNRTQVYRWQPYQQYLELMATVDGSEPVSLGLYCPHMLRTIVDQLKGRQQQPIPGYPYQVKLPRLRITTETVAPAGWKLLTIAKFWQGWSDATENWDRFYPKMVELYLAGLGAPLHYIGLFQIDELLGFLHEGLAIMAEVPA